MDTSSSPVAPVAAQGAARLQRGIPWTEKYRPTHFDGIVLDPLNRRLFANILRTDKFPHLLMYGPPGTGKTTSATNLIAAHQARHGRVSKLNVIHLNASDERGIDVIRSHIQQFVQSQNMFAPGLKIVVLDEVDYMTKTAQHALKQILQTCLANVRFVLICNYISKIDDSLKQEFMGVRFDQLPRDEVCAFLGNIARRESMPMSAAQVDAVAGIFQSDVRGMVNYLQLHQHDASMHLSLITPALWADLHARLHARAAGASSAAEVVDWILATAAQHNTDILSFLKLYYNHAVEHRLELATPAFLSAAETVFHTELHGNTHAVLLFFIHSFVAS